MPHVPGDPGAGHGHITSERPDGGFYISGTISNSGFSGGLLHNQSGICGDEVWEKYKTAPWGWFETTGYREHFRPDDSTIERVFEGPWGLRPQFIQWALGYSDSLPDPNNPERGILKREIPVMDAEFPWLYATDYELVEGHGAWVNNYFQAKDCEGRTILENGQPVWFPKIGYLAKDTTLDRLTAKVKLTFSARDFEVRSDARNAVFSGGELNRYLTRDRTYSMEAIPLPRGEIVFTEGPFASQPIPENSGRLLLPRQQLRYTWHDVPDEPVEAIENCVGRVNSHTFDGVRGARSYPPKTLLCLPPQNVRIPRTPTGRVAWRIVYLFLFQPQGWDKWPAADGRFYRANRDVFEPVGFQQLFTVPTPVAYQ